MNPICLITPPSCFLLDERVFLSLGILRVAAVLERERHVVEHLDLSGVENYGDAVRAHARQSQAGVFGLTATTPQMPAVSRVVECLREVRPDARVILGGPHVTLVNAAYKREVKRGINGRAAKAMRSLEALFDVLVAGDGEDAVFHAIMPDAPKLIDADDAASQLFLTNERYDEMPFPARHLVDVDSYHYSIEGFPALSMIAQLGCPYQSLTGDSLVFTDRGFERIEDLAGGPFTEETCIHGDTIRKRPIDRMVSTHAGYMPATQLIEEAEKPVFRVSTENGYSFKGTVFHPVMVASNEEIEWVPVGNLRIGDYLVLKTPDREWPSEYVKLTPPVYEAGPAGGFERKSDIVPSELTEDAAWLVGYLIGDGCIPNDNRPAVHFAVKDRSRETLLAIVPKLFGVELAINASGVTDKMEHGWLNRRSAREFFTQSIGIDPKDKLHIPACVLASPKSVLEAFYRGLMTADEYDNNGKPYLTTVSHDLAKEVALLMQMLGMIPSIQAITNRGIGTGNCYRVGQFYNDRIPTSRQPYKSSKSGKYYWRTMSSPTRLGVRRRNLLQSGLHHPLLIEGYHYVRVEAVEPAGIEKVYDLHVPGDHSFIANGLVVHNCAFCGGRNSPMLRRIRTRTTENILREVGDLHKQFGVTGFMFYDDEMNVSRTMVDLMNGIADLQRIYKTEFRLRGFIKSNLFTDEQAAAMRRAGFRWILVGFESGSPRILENIQKKATREQNSKCMEIARRHDLKVKALMSIGHAGESAETIQATKDWLIEERPADFDCTVITTYPGTPYYDESVETEPGIWTYTAKNGDRLHAYEVDFNHDIAAYKGIPGEYRSLVYTDHISAEELVRSRDALEANVRAQLGIPYNHGAPGVRFETSMGQFARLPDSILRTSREAVTA